MKAKFTLLWALFLFALGFSQDTKFDLLQKNTTTKILYDRVFPLSNATNIEGRVFTSNNFLQVYHEMQRADFLQRLPQLEKIREAGNKGFSNNYIPLAVLVADFESIEPKAIENRALALNENEKFTIKNAAENIFNVHHLALMGTLLGKTTDRNPTFILSKELMFNTSQRSIAFIEIENANSWKRINQDEAFQLSFANNGLQNIGYKIHFTDGSIAAHTLVLEVNYQQRAVDGKSFAPNVVNTISSTIPYKGYGESAAFTGIGEYEVFLDTVNGVLDKPIILVDGFDPGDTRNTTAIYQMLNYGGNQNLGDALRAQGYDVIVLNFPKYTRPDGVTVIDGGVDYIQRNALVLVALINKINADKIGVEKNVVIGPSMGGLISRYALRYMEQNSLNHDARLYLSFDSPHLGANVPIGFQHLFNYMAYGPLADVTMQEVVNGMLKSPAAKEMLLDHMDAHFKSGSTTEFDPAILLPAGAPNYRNPFQTELAAMGFPQTTRNVAISNGAGNGTMTGTPGMTVMDHTFNTSSTQRAIIKLNFTPLKNQTLEVSRFKGQQWILAWITFYDSGASSKSPATTSGLDSAPGGRFDIGQFAAFANGNAMLTEFLNNLNILYFDFIPTISSLAISNTNDYYASVSASSATPFAAYSVPTDNENHVTLTAQNVQFALNEILNPGTLANSENPKASVIIENPVRSSIKIKTNTNLNNAKISITDMNGRKVLELVQNINGQVDIPVRLSDGWYILTIETDKIQKIQKIVVKN